MPTARTTTTRPRKLVRQPTMIELPAKSPHRSSDSEPARPTEHNGIKVVKEQLLHNLPNGAPFRISKLHLESGGQAFACRDCMYTADTRGLVMVHRNTDHGSRYGKKSIKVSLPTPTGAPDIVLAPRADGSPAPSDPMGWTIGELLALLPSITALGDLVESKEGLADEALAALGEQRRNQVKIDSFDDVQAQLVMAKQQLRHTGDYDEIKKEVATLRAWKKNIIKKLQAVGFQLAEEDQ